MGLTTDNKVTQEQAKLNDLTAEKPTKKADGGPISTDAAVNSFQLSAEEMNDLNSANAIAKKKSIG